MKAFLVLIKLLSLSQLYAPKCNLHTMFCISMKIQRIIWKPLGVSMGYQRFDSGQTNDKEHEKIVKVQMMFQ